MAHDPRRRRAHPFLRTPTAPIRIPIARRTVEPPLCSPIRPTPALDDQLVFAFSPDCASPVCARYLRARRDSASTARHPVPATRPPPPQVPTPAQKFAAKHTRRVVQLPSPASSLDSTSSASHSPSVRPPPPRRWKSSPAGMARPKLSTDLVAAALPRPEDVQDTLPEELMGHRREDSESSLERVRSDLQKFLGLTGGPPPSLPERGRRRSRR